MPKTTKTTFFTEEILTKIFLMGVVQLGGAIIDVYPSKKNPKLKVHSTEELWARTITDGNKLTIIDKWEETEWRAKITLQDFHRAFDVVSEQAPDLYCAVYGDSATHEQYWDFMQYVIFGRIKY